MSKTYRSASAELVHIFAVAFYGFLFLTLAILVAPIILIIMWIQERKGGGNDTAS